MQHNYQTELYHYGVKGMKWGIKRARPNVYITKGRAGARSDSSTSNAKQSLTPEQKAARRKKVLKIGAAVAGTALAAYGTYKLSKYVQNKRNAAAMKKATDYINENFLEKVGYHHTKFRDGSSTYESMFRNNAGMNLTVDSRRSKAVGKHNAKVVAKGRQIYKDATNTRLDRGLSKIVGAGDAVGNAAKRTGNAVGNAAKRTGDAVGNAAKRTGNAVGNAAKRTGNTVKSAGTTAKNRVLDVVNPIYSYRPGETTTTTRTSNGITFTEQNTKYYKYKVKRK